MPWNNNSGGGGWKGGGGGPWGQGPQQRGPQPPDLEELLKRSQDRLRNMLPGGGRCNVSIAVLIVAALVVLWVFNCVYMVQPDELGQELVFGKPKNEVATQGLHFIFWPVETVENVPTRVQREFIGSDAAAPQRRRHQPDALRRPEHRRDQFLGAVARQRSEEVPLQRQRAGGLPAPRRGKRHARAGRPLDRRGGAHRAARRGRGGRARAAAGHARQPTTPASPSSACSSNAPTRRPRWPTPSRKCSARSRISTASSARPSNTPTGGSAMRAARRRRSPRRRIGYKQQVVAEAEGESQRFLSVLAEYEQAEDVTRKRLFLETDRAGVPRLQQDHPRRRPAQGVLPYLPLDQLQRTGRPATPRQPRDRRDRPAAQAQQGASQ